MPQPDAWRQNKTAWPGRENVRLPLRWEQAVRTLPPKRSGERSERIRARLALYLIYGPAESPSGPRLGWSECPRRCVGGVFGTTARDAPGFYARQVDFGNPSEDFTPRFERCAPRRKLEHVLQQPRLTRQVRVASVTNGIAHRASGWCAEALQKGRHLRPLESAG